MSYDVSEVNRIIAEKMAIDMKYVQDDVSIIRGLGADSLDIVEIIMHLEDHYDIEISDDYAMKCDTVEDVKNAIKSIMMGDESVKQSKIANAGIMDGSSRIRCLKNNADTIAKSVQDAKALSAALASKLSLIESLVKEMQNVCT